jgi:hypothetical protein
MARFQLRGHSSQPMCACAASAGTGLAQQDVAGNQDRVARVSRDTAITNMAKDQCAGSGSQ